MSDRDPTDKDIADWIGDPRPVPPIPPVPDPNDEMRAKFFAQVAGWLVRRVDLAQLRIDYTTPDTLPEFAAELEAFIASATPKHDCWEFSSPQSHWDRLAGRAGFALVLDGTVTNVIATIIS